MFHPRTLSTLALGTAFLIPFATSTKALAEGTDSNTQPPSSLLLTEEVCGNGDNGLRLCVSQIDTAVEPYARPNSLPSAAGSSAACDKRTGVTVPQILTRTHSCASTVMHVKVMQGTSTTGSVDIQVREDTYANTKSLTVSADWTLTRFNVQGTGEYVAPAVEGHRTVPATNVDQKITLTHGMINSQHRFSGSLVGTPAAGKFETMMPAADLGFWMEGFAQPVWLTKKFDFAPVRCDRIFTTAGCVTPWGAPPTLQLTRTGNYIAYYDHVSRAIKSGLPSILTKDSSRQTANRKASCGSRPPIKGKQCDEYPFASTAEGAARNPKSPRSFAGCSIDAPSATGPYGFSICMIDASSNAAGGAQLGNFFVANRVIDQDSFSIRL